ncbi:hypothetical protein [Burkholderia multivorans]|uniref:hypothetical protein n=1 Tax=Burkholderia multivorans TaxID=87883 RepID=UPI001C274CB4|nr:hypothetical protein [Burkholderia multivorans]MBU9576283.1 hypothetical protein [Burkholderia multivorans]MDN7953799.1 hypothetical protein [Burkholderia multivorans]MDN7999978.1 hypothetical protein [Burkholderia multivorans]
MNLAIKRCVRDVLVALSMAMMLSAVPTLARADDWGCQVLLCLSNPGGPEQYGACVPPIEKLWTALRHGDPFPACDFSAGLASLSPDVRNAIPAAWLADLGAGTGASNTWAGSGYCREDLLYWGGPEESIPLCRASGAINVMIDGALYMRVWWGTGGVDGNSTITEYYGPPDLSGMPDQVAYDPTQAFARWMQAQDDASSRD